MISPHTPPGTKIVCTDAEPHKRYVLEHNVGTNMHGLTKDAVYTVREIMPYSLTVSGFIVCLDEIVRGFYLEGYDLKRFRRLELPSSLTSILETAPVRAPTELEPVE